VLDVDFQLAVGIDPFMNDEMLGAPSGVSRKWSKDSMVAEASACAMLASAEQSRLIKRRYLRPFMGRGSIIYNALSQIIAAPKMGRK
jgi:hypothetical protein